MKYSVKEIENPDYTALGFVAKIVDGQTDEPLAFVKTYTNAERLMDALYAHSASTRKGHYMQQTQDPQRLEMGFPFEVCHDHAVVVYVANEKVGEVMVDLLKSGGKPSDLYDSFQTVDGMS